MSTKRLVTIRLSRKDRDRRLRWRTYQLLCAELLKRYSAGELKTMLARLKGAESRRPDCGPIAEREV